MFVYDRLDLQKQHEMYTLNKAQYAMGALSVYFYECPTKDIFLTSIFFISIFNKEVNESHKFYRFV